MMTKIQAIELSAEKILQGNITEAQISKNNGTGQKIHRQRKNGAVCT